MNIIRVIDHCMIRTDEDFRCTCGYQLCEVYTSWDQAVEYWQKHITLIIDEPEPCPQEQAMSKTDAQRCLETNHKLVSVRCMCGIRVEPL